MRARRAVLLLISAQLFSQVPADRSADVYAIYNVLLNDLKLSHRDGNTKYLIAEMTGIQGDNPIRCVAQIPSAYKSSFDEIAKDYEQRKMDSSRLERKFSIQKPYELLTPPEVEAFQKSRVVGRDIDAPPEPEKFSGAVDLIRLGNIYFNQAHTLAVVETEAWCGGLCGLWHTRVLEKKDGRWQDLHWNACAAIA